MFDDEIDQRNNDSKKGGVGIDVGGEMKCYNENFTEDEMTSQKAHKIFTGKNILSTFNFRNRKFLMTAFGILCCLLIFISVAMYFHSEKIKRENLKNLSGISTASPDVLNKQYIKDSLSKIQPYENKLMNRVINKNSETNSFNKRDLSITNYLNDLDNYKKTSSDELANLQKESCSKEVNNYRNNVIKEYQAFIQGIDNETKYMNGRISGQSTVDMDVCQSDYRQLINIYRSNSTELTNIENMCK